MNRSGAVQRLVALLQIASPMLPVGAYAYSQGLERAVEDRIVTDAPSARRWILDSLEGPLAHWEAPLLSRLVAACNADDAATFAHWNARFVASRETAELRAETLQMGGSLATWMRAVAAGGDGIVAQARDGFPPPSRWSFPAAFAHCADTLSIATEDALAAYLWSWIENQVAAAMKAVPLGQVAGQRLLIGSHDAIAAAVNAARRLGDDALWSSSPGLALASARHESQYSRLFRS